MKIRTLKKQSRAALRKNYFPVILVGFIITFDIHAVLSIFSDDILTPILKLHEINFEAIKEYIIHHHLPKDFKDIIVSLLVLLFEIFILYVLKVGGTRYFIKIKNEDIPFTEIFFCFRKKSRSNLHVSFVLALKTLTIILWGLLFIIPGIIKFYDYAAVEYLLAISPDLSAKDAMRLSKTMMNGYKLKFIVLELSFLGWDILEFISFGILNYLYITPYKLLTYDEFFAYIKEEAEKNGNEELKKLTIK